MAAFVVLPAFFAVWLLAAPVALQRRVVDVALGSLVLATISLAWVALYDLTPSDRRPYAGGSRTNSMLQLAVGHSAPSVNRTTGEDGSLSRCLPAPSSRRQRSRRSR